MHLKRTLTLLTNLLLASLAVNDSHSVASAATWDPAARYTVVNLDSGETETLAGPELLEKGCGWRLPSSQALRCSRTTGS